MKTRKPKDSKNDVQVPNQLTDEQIAERGRQLARRNVEHAALERRKKNAVKQINAELKECQALIDQLSEEMVHGMEMIRQGDLFVKKPQDTEAPQPAVAASTLAEIARRAQDAPEDEDGDEGNGKEPAKEATPHLKDSKAAWRGKKGPRPLQH